MVANLEKALQSKLAEAEEKFQCTIQHLTEENILLRYEWCCPERHGWVIFRKWEGVGWGIGGSEPGYSLVKSRHRHGWQGAWPKKLLTEVSSSEVMPEMCPDSSPLPMLVFIQKDPWDLPEPLNIFSFRIEGYFQLQSLEPCGLLLWVLGLEELLYS